MSTSQAQHVVIIGGGFAGTVTAIKLARATPVPLRISIIESREEIGRGIAYSTRLTTHLVNDPAKNFTLYADQPEHLANWLREQASARDGWQPPAGVAWADAFAPRHLYGDYLQDELENTLAQAPHAIEFRHVVDRAIDLERASDGRWTVRLATGLGLQADRVVLATGLFTATLGRGDLDIDPELIAEGRVVDDIWASAPNDLSKDQDAVIIGNGLSALDAMLSAHAQGFRGHFHGISRRGLLVARRHDATPWPPFLDAQALPTTLRSLLRQVRSAHASILDAGEDWQRLTGAVRPHVPALWNQASDAERKRFIRHLRAYWEISLHKAAPESATWLEALRQAERYSKLTGRVRRIARAASGRIAVTWQPRREARARIVEVDRVFNSRGFEFDWTRIDDPLLRQLVARAYVVPHSTGFGIDAVSHTGAVISKTLDTHGLYAVGHPLRGVNWESNAIGEQLAGATATAQALALSLQPALAVAA
ncbi:FAD/NAD(P)-binding protein [Bordetella sp. LUAb4]|uniref:FAD/NAD(P)-binding protein n=1 Tax=Bordetella sp. LUAb4 TaxID=2843195 RepID=UPI001E515DCD|nr:FAD/NAD(P)-binding protein [Bordetella sp. LUAb4]